MPLGHTTVYIRERSGKGCTGRPFPGDNGTCLAMERYLARARKQANSKGLANAVTDYWNSLKDEFGGPDKTNLDETNPAPADHELAPRTAREWFRRKGYRWADLKKGV